MGETPAEWGSHYSNYPNPLGGCYIKYLVK
jgi:hypothetical protein